MCCCNCCNRWTYQIIKVKSGKNSRTHFIWYLLCSEQPSACFMNIMKWNHVLEAKKVHFFRSVRCSNNFGHYCTSDNDHFSILCMLFNFLLFVSAWQTCCHWFLSHITSGEEMHWLLGGRRYTRWWLLSLDTYFLAPEGINDVWSHVKECLFFVVLLRHLWPVSLNNYHSVVSQNCIIKQRLRLNSLFCLGRKGALMLSFLPPLA